MPWSLQVTIRLWMMPTCLAPSSVQQKSHDFLLCMYFHKRRYPRFVIMEGRRATIAQNRYLYASVGSRLHRFAFHNCRCFLLGVHPSRGEFPWFGTHVSGRDSNPAKSGLRLHRSEIQRLRTFSILPSVAMPPGRSGAISEALLTLFIGLLSEGFAPGTFASR